MTTEQLRRMRAGREAQLTRQRERYAEDQLKYVNWVKSEARAFASRARAELDHGRDSDEFKDRDSSWREVWITMPEPPPDHAWSAT